jgi:hypothetical protein
MKWVLIAAVIFVLFGDRLFSRSPTVVTRPIYKPDPLYGPTPAPTYASAPPPAPRPSTNVGDVAVAGIRTFGDVLTNLDPFGWGTPDTGDN